MSLRLTLCTLVSLYLSSLSLVAGVPVVQLGETTVNGVSHPQLGQEFFGGIPFAEPPLGPLRFAPPVLKLTPGVPTLNATAFGFSCVQGIGFGGPGMPVPFDNTTMSEDCLTVNVFRPSGLNESSQLPVMVWVYGGGFLDGSSSMFNASAIVGQSILRGSPVVYASLNYRVGPFGFPQGEEATARGALNLGNKDVLAALTWIQNNIGAFGGDKDKVTIFGESAGAMVNAQNLLNSSFDLARAAIFESGSAASHTLLPGPARESAWQFFVSGVPECASSINTSHTFECLRSASTAELFMATSLALGEIQEEFAFSPVVDGPGGIIPDLPSRLFAKDEFAHIPFITGTNLDEGPLFLPTTFNSTALLREWIISNSTPSVVSPAEFNFVLDELLKLYPNVPALGSPFGTGNETFGLNPEFKRAGALFGDVAFTSLRRQWATAASNSGMKVFAYLFTDPQTNTDPPFLGVPHGSDIVYVYGAPQNGPASVALSHNMIDYWVSFATSLTPNDGLGNTSRATWEQFNPASPAVLELNSVNLTMIPDTFRKTQIDFMSAHPEALLH